MNSNNYALNSHELVITIKNLAGFRDFVEYKFVVKILPMFRWPLYATSSEIYSHILALLIDNYGLCVILMAAKHQDYIGI